MAGYTGDGYGSIRPFALSFSSNTAIPTDTKNIPGSETEGLTPMMNTCFYGHGTMGTPSVNTNPAEGYPYFSVSWTVAAGLGTGTIKTLITGGFQWNASYWARKSIGAFVVLSSDEWIIKEGSDSMAISWIFYLSGVFKTKNWF